MPGTVLDEYDTVTSKTKACPHGLHSGEGQQVRLRSNIQTSKHRYKCLGLARLLGLGQMGPSRIEQFKGQ